MKNIIVVLIACLTTACVSNARYAALERRNADLERKDLERRQKNAERDGYQPPGAPGVPSASPQPPNVSGPTVVGNGGLGGGTVGMTGATIARRQHGVYMGTVGAQSRQVTVGPKLQLVNHVCDRGSRNAWSRCWDADANGADDFNTFLAFEIDGQPVVCDSRFVHPDTGESLLAPGQTCFVELGRSRRVTLTVRAYRNFGTTASVMLDAAPDASTDKGIDLAALSNTGYYEIDEARF